MGWIRRILWIAGGLIIVITFLTMMSQIYIEGLAWEDLNMNAYLLGYIFGGIFIGSMFLWDLVSYITLRSDIHNLMDETEQITPEEIVKELDEPLWRVLPIFRKREDPGILILTSGKYIHFNEEFQEKFLKQYSKGLTIGEIAHHFNLSKTEINLIIDELDYKGSLPDVEAPLDRPKKERTTKGLRKTVRLRKRKIKKKR